MVPLVQLSKQEIASLFSTGTKNYDDEYEFDFTDKRRNVFLHIKNELIFAELLVCIYETEYISYTGNAFILYKKNESLFIVEGSHCSCHGLEDQWQPALYSYAAMSKREFMCFPENVGDQLRKFALEQLEKLASW